MKAVLTTLVLTVFSFPLALSQSAQLPPCSDPIAIPLNSRTLTSRLDEQLRKSVFAEVHDTIRYSYPGSNFYGVDWNGLRADYLTRVLGAANDQEVYAALEEMVGLLQDNVSAFVSADEVRAEDEAFAVPPGESFGGLGLSVEALPTPGSLAVEGVFPSSPAAVAGLKPGDRILAVDGDPCPHLLKIRGPVGSEVTLTLRSRGEPSRDVTLRRASIAADADPMPLPVRSRRLAAFPDIGYVSLPGFEAELDRAAKFATELRSLLAKPHLRGLILDFRASGYGDYGETERIVGMLGGVDQIGSFRRRFSETQLVAKPTPTTGRLQQVPLAVLVGEQTADIAELVAASLQQQGRAIIVGQPTSGTVWGVDERELADGSLLMFPVDQTVLPDGTKLGRGGVTPDVMVEEDWFGFSEEDDPYIRAAALLLQDRDR